MSTAARPADVVEALVERAQSEGALSLDELRTTFEQAGIGPAEAGAVLRRLTEAGAVLGTQERPAKRRSTPARPAVRRTARQATRPSGRTVEATTEPVPDLTDEALVTVQTPAAPVSVPAEAAAPAAETVIDLTAPTAPAAPRRPASRKAAEEAAAPTEAPVDPGPRRRPRG